MFITHDLSVVKHISDEILVMYLGQCVEHCGSDELFENPLHPYTKALLSATPVADPLLRKERIKLTGELPSPMNKPDGCSFNPRCWRKQDICTTVEPKLQGQGHCFACHNPVPVDETVAV